MRYHINNIIHRAAALLVLLMAGWAAGGTLSAQETAGELTLTPDPETNLTGTASGDNIQPLTAWTDNDTGIYFSFETGTGRTAPAYYANGANVRLYSGNTFQLHVPEGCSVTEAVFDNSYTSSSEKTLSVDTGNLEYYEEVSEDGAVGMRNYIWTNSDNASVATFTLNDTQIRLTSVRISYTGGSVSDRPKAPVISEKSRTFYLPFEITIVDPNEPAGRVYYTLDGSEPSAQSILYTGPVTIPEGADVTVKAVVVTELGTSNVAIAAYTYEKRYAFSYSVNNKNAISSFSYDAGDAYDSLSPDQKVYIAPGQTVYLNWNINSGYKLNSVKNNGVPVENPSYAYNFTMPEEDVTAAFDAMFDPSSPGDPQPPVVKYRLIRVANPSGAYKYGNASEYAAGESVYVSAGNNSGYKFLNWTKDGQTISTESSFHYEMPAADVVLVANYVYAPSDPGDPQQPKLTHPLTVVAQPAGSASFSKTADGIVFGEEYYVYAYPQTGYKFVKWILNGVPQDETSTSFHGTMTEAGASLVAVMKFDPSAPSNPGANYYNPTTGLAIIDDFSAGNLYNALSNTVGYDNFGNVSRLIVKGKMSSNDYGCLSSLSNANTIDLSRTGSTAEVPGYAFQDLAASDILLSASVASIGNYAFSNCSNLVSLTVYSQEPPVCSSNTFTDFTNKDNCTVFVPASAIELYSNAEYWKDFTILPINNDAHVLQVNLPADGADGRYKHNSIEIVNLNSGVRQKYVVSDRMLYTFSSLQKDEQYNVYMYSQAGLEIGRIENVVIPDQDSEVTFGNLKSLHTVYAKVLASDGTDVTPQVSVEWLKPLADGTETYLRKAVSLGEVPDGQQLICRVTLDDRLGLVYANPEDVEFTVSADNNICTLSLAPFRSIELTGSVVDGDEAALSGASVSVNQTLNGKYSKTYTARTDRAGKWSLSVLDAPETRLTFAATECVNVNDTIGAFEASVNTLDLGKTVMKSIVGARVSYGFTYHAAGSEEMQDYYSDYQNVAVSVFNVTQNRAHNEVSLQYPILAVLDENIHAGDELKLTASSKTGAFNPIVESVTVDESQRAEVTFDIVGKGGISAMFEMTENPAVTAMLYGSNGELQKKMSYSEAKALFTELEDGEYTLITMGQSDLMNSILRLSNFGEIGLTEGKDYVKNMVNVESGKLSEVKIAEVPAFDESLFYYTNSATGFSANKSSITTGNYLTLSSTIAFKGVYSNDISNVALVVDLPEACDFIENSVIQGPNLLPYTIDNNRLTIQLGDKYLTQTRFCVIPTSGGTFNATASIVFDYNGKTFRQSIGSALSEIKDLDLLIPSVLKTPMFIASGKAPAKSKIQLIDGNTMIGETKANGNGFWNIQAMLSDSTKYSHHAIYAHITMSNGVDIISEKKICQLNPKVIQPETTVMSFYNGWLHKNVSVVFDHINRRIDNPNYMFYTTTNIAFQTKFSEGEPSLISNVQIHLMSKNGDIQSLSMLYDDKIESWVASGEYGFDTTPINISISYDYFDDSSFEPLSIAQNVIEDFGNYGITNLVKTETYASFDILPCRIETSIPCIIRTISLDDTTDFLSQIEHLGFTLENSFESFSLYKDKDDDFILIEEGDSLTAKAYFSSRNGVFNEYNSLVHSVINKSPQKIKVDLDGNYYRSTDRLNRWVDEHIMNNVIAMMDRKRPCNEGKPEWNEAVLAMAHLQQIFAASVYSMLGSTLNITSLAQRPRDIVDVGLFGANAVSSNVPFLEADGLYRKSRSELEKIRNLPECSPCNRPKQRLSNVIRKSYNNGNSSCPTGNCGNDLGNDFPPMSPIHDPSGFVYEAVPDNRVEGVQASIYYKETKENMYGDPYEEVVLWDAEEYAQKNPLFTDENGMYQWDVPQGLWQVKFEKDGYQTAFSEWLPVPPPQLDVNIGIVQNKQPEVTEARAYEEGVEVQFDKFMDLSTLTTDNIYVTANGEKLTGEIRMIDSTLADEYASEEDANALRYASRVRFVPEQPLSVTTGEVRVTVSRNVLSYAGIPMTETFSQVLDVEKEVQMIVADDVKVLYGGEKEVTVHAVPFDAAVGRTLHIANSSALIASVDVTEATLDAEGKAVVKVKGDLPGRAQLTFTIDDVTATGECAVDVVTEIINAEAPKSSRASGSAVYRGSKIELTTDSKNATIYFTTDGSCPCDENGTRRKYTVPIVINEDTKILAMTSVGTGDEDMSETVEFNYTLKHSDMDFRMEEGWTWMSHNFDNAVAPTALSSDESVSRILTHTQELIRDPQLGMVGTLTELSASESFKVETSAAVTGQRLSDIARNPATPIALNAGWNWLGYPVGQTMTVDEAFATTEAETLDIVVGQNGFAQFDGEKWVGTLETMSPGLGYMYQSQSAKNVIYNTSIVSTASAKHASGISGNSPLVLDIHKYGVIMPVVATINGTDGSQLDNEDYQVAAFCGTECRGIGRIVNGLVMMNVYGNPDDGITFKVTDADGELSFSNDASLKFSETVVGDIFNPYVLMINSQSGVSDVKYDGNIKVAVEDDMLRIKGIAPDDIDLVEIYDIKGQKLIRETNVSESGIRISSLTNGVYVVIVKGNGEYSYHKIAIR